MALRDRLLGDPSRLDGPGLARAVRRGSEALAVRAVRALGERDEEAAVDFLVPLLVDERAGLRRAAMASLGHLGRARALPALEAAWARDHTEEGRITNAVAQVRCGADPTERLAALEAYERRSAYTWQGPRSPTGAVAAPPLAMRFWQGLSDDPPHVQPRAALRASRRAALGRTAVEGSDERTLLQALGALRHPDDHDFLLAHLRSAGRREEHAISIALGLCGDPRAFKPIADLLFATDVDPGRGFTQRRLAATALGRLGLRDATPVLLRALENEALDYEGRPGAGMGVQYPVRTNLLWAMGEVGDPATIPTLAGYLANTHGSAFGGFYLPAMDALYKLGPAAAPAMRQLAADGAEIVAGNAVGVLAAIGEDVRPWQNDPRPAVAAVARGAPA